MLVKLKNELKQEIKEVVAAQNKEIELLQSTVSLLQQHVKVLKQSLNSQAKNTEDLAQYGRRNCLRIDGIPRRVTGGGGGGGALGAIAPPRIIICPFFK